MAIFWVILAVLAKMAILVVLASHFRARLDTPTKSPTWGLASINVTEPHAAVVFSDTLLHRDKIRVLGVSRHRSGTSGCFNILFYEAYLVDTGW